MRLVYGAGGVDTLSGLDSHPCVLDENWEGYRSADFLMETLKARRERQEIFKVIKSKNLQPRLLYPAKLSFRITAQTKSFPHQNKLKEFFTIKSMLYEMLKGL